MFSKRPDGQEEPVFNDGFPLTIPSCATKGAAAASPVGFPRGTLCFSVSIFSAAAPAKRVRGWWGKDAQVRAFIAVSPQGISKGAASARPPFGSLFFHIFCRVTENMVAAAAAKPSPVRDEDKIKTPALRSTTRRCRCALQNIRGTWSPPQRPCHRGKAGEHSPCSR